MRVRYTAVCVALFMILCGAAPAMAAESGIYLGGGVGQATFDDDVPDIGDINEDDMAWKAFVGYRLGFIPILDFAAELTYRDFGKPDGANFEYDSSGYDASVLAIFALGPVDLFGRLGFGNYEVKKTVSGVHSEEDGTGALYGLGAGLRLGKLAVRLEWERAEPDGLKHIDMYTINAYWRF